MNYTSVITKNVVRYLFGLLFGLLSVCAVVDAATAPLAPFGADLKTTPNEAVAGAALKTLSISIDGDWHFATDPGDQGIQEEWYGDTFDDSQWQILKSGRTWDKQGIDHAGYGWYRQRIFVPKAYAGTALTLILAPMPSDDDTWFNGVRVGGISSEYKYNNWITRSYTIPPSSIRYGQENTIAIRCWGGYITFIRNDGNGLGKGPLVAVLDPYGVKMREPGGEAVAYQLFDLSEAQRGRPFEIVFSLPADAAKEAGAQLSYTLNALGKGREIKSGKVPLTAGPGGVLQAVVAIDRETAQTIYLRGIISAAVRVEGKPGTSKTWTLNYISFAKRDQTPLPPLPEKFEETPYGKLRLVDEIDCSTSLFDDPHPYLQGGFDHVQDRVTPGAPIEVKVSDIVGKKARETGYGWFAYRIGRGKLKPHTTYLVRIEYPEDQPRFCPIEMQTGQNFMDVGWESGVGDPNDVYAPWPLSKKWQWYDTIVPLDDQTVGTGGTGSAPAENGFWIYFMNKLKPNVYYAMYDGGPAIARMQLYEIDPEKNAPAIQRPKDLPNRVLSFDWERQPDHDPADLARYAKLMGYSAISPVILKWSFANYSDPLNGYETDVIDAHDYWARKEYDPKAGEKAASPIPGTKSQHNRYLEATRQWGLDYIPRFEWGGSLDLPEEARSIGADGRLAKPNRYGSWGANLLNPLAWDDLKKLMDHLIKPYAKDHPQLTGVLWRIRCDRMQISYGKADLEMFARETQTPLPAGGAAQVASGELKAKYEDWWHRKRAQFHIELAELLKSYRPDLTLYYYNWDNDKFSLIEPSLTTADFSARANKKGRAAYEQDRALRKGFTAQDYIASLHSGNFGKASKGINRADYGIRPELYKDAKGIQILAPLNYLCYTDKPELINYFQTADGLAASNAVSYDEIGSRAINPKYEGNMVTPCGAPFSMALELLSYFHGDARTLNYTVYTYGRGFADAHRRFAQAFLALPAIPGTVVDQGDPDVKVRTYASANGVYVGVAYKGYADKRLTLKVPAKAGATITNLVTNEPVPATAAGNDLQFELLSGPMELNAFLMR